MGKLSGLFARTVLVFMILLVTGNVSAKYIFVSPSILTAREGSFEEPYFSIQNAIDNAAPGDTIFVMNGYYKQKALVRGIRSKKDNPLVIKALGKVIIDSPESIEVEDTVKIGDYDVPISDPKHLYYPYYRGGVFRVEHTSNVVIDGFNIRNSPWFSISSLYATGLTIKNCLLQDSQASAIYLLNTKDIIVEYNEVLRACGYPRRIDSHGSQEMISIVNSSEFEIRYNIVHETNNWNVVERHDTGVGGEGIDVKESSHDGSVHHNYVYNLTRPGLYVDAWDSRINGNIEIYNNVVDNTQNGVALSCENGGKLTNIKVYNNLLIDNWLDGVILSAWSKGGDKNDIYICNNTIFRNMESGIRLGSEKHKGIHVYNNIMYQNIRYKKPEFHLENALEVTSKTNTLTETNPMFIEPGTNNYQLTEESPCIDVGTKPPFEIKFDLNDAPRVKGDGIDIGAYEFGSEPVSPRIMYVGHKGNDDVYPGTVYMPYRTIQKAVDMAKPGDHIVVLPGMYNEQVMIKGKKGDADNPIRISAPQGATIIGSALELDEGTGLVSLENASYIVLEGLTIKCAFQDGVNIKNSENITVTNCCIKMARMKGINVNGSKNIDIRFNKIAQTDMKENMEAMKKMAGKGIMVNDSQEVLNMFNR